MYTFVSFYAHKNKNINYNQISPNSINTEFLLPFFSHDSPLRLDPSQRIQNNLDDPSQLVIQQLDILKLAYWIWQQPVRAIVVFTLFQIYAKDPAKFICNNRNLIMSEEQVWKFSFQLICFLIYQAKYFCII